MSATVVTTEHRVPISGVLSPETVEHLCSGDTRRQWGLQQPYGQLWERVADGRASEALWTGDLIDAIGTVKRERMSKTMRTRSIYPEHSWTFDLDPGPKLSTFRNPTVSGIIRAGERVK